MLPLLDFDGAITFYVGEMIVPVVLGFVKTIGAGV